MHSCCLLSLPNPQFWTKIFILMEHWSGYIHPFGFGTKESAHTSYPFSFSFTRHHFYFPSFPCPSSYLSHQCDEAPEKYLIHVRVKTIKLKVLLVMCYITREVYAKSCSVSTYFLPLHLTPAHASFEMRIQKCWSRLRYDDLLVDFWVRDLLDWCWKVVLL